jgi:hypothetical protein
MRALSIKQPWASLIVHGFKRFEMRNWPTRHRGRILIHASKTWSAAQLAFFESAPVRGRLEPFLPLPFGALIGFVDIVECYHVRSMPRPASPESIWSDFDSFTYAFELAHPIPISRPAYLKGDRGLVEIADDLAKSLLQTTLADYRLEPYPRLRNLGRGPHAHYLPTHVRSNGQPEESSSKEAEGKARPQIHHRHSRSRGQPKQKTPRGPNGPLA